VKKLVTIIAAGVSAAAILSTASTAHAFAGEAKQVRVSYADLNLANAAGRQTFQRRLNQAAEQVCGPYGISLRENRYVSACLTQTLAAAKARVEVVSAARSDGGAAVTAMQ